MHVLNKLTLITLLPHLAAQRAPNRPPPQVSPDQRQHQIQHDRFPVPFPFPSDYDCNSPTTNNPQEEDPNHSSQCPDQTQTQNNQHPNRGVSPSFFLSLERLARLVDITYCVNTPPGSPGIRPPFSCASRCRDFPSVHLVQTWSTGALLGDSCGFVAVDHGAEWGGDGDGGGGGGGGGGGRKRGEILVAFRGTYSLANAVVDLSTVPQEYVPYPSEPDRDYNSHPAAAATAGGGGGGSRTRGDYARDRPGGPAPPRCENCTVHMGFMASWRSARDTVLPALRRARAAHPGYRVHLVGHSLGGAVAALAGLELKLKSGLGRDGEGVEEVMVTTFGEPRVGNEALSRYIDLVFGLLEEEEEEEEEEEGGGESESGRAQRTGEKRAYRRVTHAGDPVPLLPLAEWGYRSHAGEVFIAKPDLQPEPADLVLCRGDDDPACIGGAEKEDWLRRAVAWIRGLKAAEEAGEELGEMEEVRYSRRGWFPARFKLWQLFFAHRDYFWRLGLCVPGGDPWDWGRERYNVTSGDGVDEMGDL